MAYMSLEIPSEHELTLQEFEIVFGQFSHLDFLGCRGEFNFQECYVRIIILEAGISAECTIDVPPKKHEHAKITPNQKIIEINFFAPGLKGYDEFYYGSWKPHLLPWQGYGKYDLPEDV